MKPSWYFVTQNKMYKHEKKFNPFMSNPDAYAYFVPFPKKGFFQ